MPESFQRLFDHGCHQHSLACCSAVVVVMGILFGENRHRQHQHESQRKIYPDCTVLECGLDSTMDVFIRMELQVCYWRCRNKPRFWSSIVCMGLGCVSGRIVQNFYKETLQQIAFRDASANHTGNRYYRHNSARANPDFARCLCLHVSGMKIKMRRASSPSWRLVVRVTRDSARKPTQMRVFVYKTRVSRVS